MARIAFEQERGRRFRPHDSCDRVVRRDRAEVEKTAEVSFGGSRIPFEALRDRRLHEPQPNTGRAVGIASRRIAPAALRPKDQQSGGDDRSETPAVEIGDNDAVAEQGGQSRRREQSES